MTDERRGTGRPKKTPDERRTERLSGLRLTTAERQHVEAQAERAGLSVAEFCRRATLAQTIRPRPARVEDAAIVALNRVGVNLHQIVRALNFGTSLPKDIAKTLADVRAAVEKLAGGTGG